MKLGSLAFRPSPQIMTPGDPLYFKKGTWYRGQEPFNPSEYGHFLVNYHEAYTGWTRWSDKKPVEQRLVRCSDYVRKESREALGHLDKNAWETNDRGVPQDPWQPSDRIILRTMDSAQDLLTFISGSVGGRNAIAKLLGKVARSVHAEEGKMPVVKLETGTYDPEVCPCVDERSAQRRDPILMDARAITTALGGKWQGSHGRCRCPVQADSNNNPSLKVSDS
jgi:hypothetical protein